MAPYPDLTALIEPYIGKPYTTNACLPTVAELYATGWGLPLGPDEPLQLVHYMQEIWFQTDATDPLTLSQPWDLWILRGKGLSSHHVGIVLDAMQLVHTREKVGLCLERLRVWKGKLLQIARLKHLR